MSTETGNPAESAGRVAGAPDAAPDVAGRTPPRAGRRVPLPPWLLLAVLAYTLVYSYLSIIRHATFHSYTFDLGIMAQTIWNTAQGRPFETSVDRSENAALIGSYLGNHVRPIILLFAPLYRLWPDPRLLLVLQSLALGLGTVPLYWVAHRLIGKRIGEIALVCAYLAYPALGFANLFDFHAQVFAIPCLFLAYWARLERKRGLFWTAVVLALSTKEELAIPLGVWGAIGLLLALWQRSARRYAPPAAFQGMRTSLGLVVLAAAWAGLSIGVIVPFYNDGRPYRFLELWAHLATVMGHIARGVPSDLRGGLPSPWEFVLHLLLPLGTVPFLGPAPLLVSLPSFVYLMAGTRASFRSVGYHYPTVLIPWLFLATAEGLSWLACRRVGALRIAVVSLVTGTVLVQLVFNPIERYTRDGAFRRDPEHDQIGAALSLIPPEAGVATINRFGAHLSRRRVLLPLEYPPPLRLDHLRQVDYVLLDLVDCRAVEAEDRRQAYAELVGHVLATGDFRVAYRAERIVVLARGPLPEDAGCVVLSASGLPGCVPGAACARTELCRVAEAVAELAAQGRACWP